MSVRVRYKKLNDDELTSKTFIVGLDTTAFVTITTNPIVATLNHSSMGKMVMAAGTLADAKKIGKTMLINVGVEFSDEVRVRSVRSTLNNSVNTPSENRPDDECPF